jgi:hypothetical protein
MNEKTKNIVYWGLTGLVAFVFIGSGLVKLSGGEQAATMAAGLGGKSHVQFLGILELAIAALWLVPRTGVLAALLAVAYLGGAMAVHFISSQPIMVPLVLQILVWLVSIYRFPELKKRLFNS